MVVSFVIEGNLMYPTSTVLSLIGLTISSGTLELSLRLLSYLLLNHNPSFGSNTCYPVLLYRIRRLYGRKPIGLITFPPMTDIHIFSLVSLRRVYCSLKSLFCD